MSDSQTGSRGGKGGPMRDGLTDRQREILTFIGEFQRNRKRPPAVREIGDAVGLSSPCTVYRHLETLEKRGFIKREPGKARAIEIVHNHFKEPATRAVPVLGRIAAGQPLLAQENVAGQIGIPEELLGAGDFFALEVNGDSMIEEGILSGDVVVLKRQETATEGDIVAALSPHDQEGTATLKRFYVEGERIKLQPANHTMEPLYFGPQDDLRILGKAVYLSRQL